RFAEAARAVGLPTVFGAELSIGLTRPQNGVADPEGRHLVILAADPVGYTRLARAISVAHLLGGAKGRPVVDLTTLAAIGAGGLPDFADLAAGVSSPIDSTCRHWMILTGCRKGLVPAALLDHGPGRAAAELQRLQQLFGRDRVVVEIWDHGDPLDSTRNDALVAIADRAGAAVVATNNVHYHHPSRRPLATALAAVRARRSLDDMDGWLPGGAGAHLRRGAEQLRRFARYPGVVERAAELGRACAFDLSLVAPKLPPWPVPPGETEMSYLRQITEAGATRRYGPRPGSVPGGRNGTAAGGAGAPARAGEAGAAGPPAGNVKAWRQIDHELDMIEKLEFPGYFLIVWDIVEFCRTHDIYCQGRGSAANSAVCYALGITKADAVGLGLLFERFLSPERDGPPDIDVDIESGRREEAIQYVYRRYGRGAAAQVANVITYRPRSAVRDMGKALGAAQGQLDAWSKQVDAWGPLTSTADHEIPDAVMELAGQVQHFPRHLGIHSGGMVICDRPVSEVCPVEWARMADRSVLQWDKDDCAAAGLVKFDMLGLGMLTVLHAAVDHVLEFHGVEVDLAAIDQEPEVYDMLCRADSVGIFQVESRAQMATLPRLKPREFYDLVVEVALIRPGPIQGGSVHPYIRRRNGTEKATYLHPLLEKSLAKTLGVPLFQEQLMQMAIDVAGFTAAESDQLRQAMGSKRSVEKMTLLKGRLYEGMAERGIVGEVADAIWDKLVAFANFGFPESHSVSFAYLVYSSAWLKHHYPSAFCAGLLDGQPMGFWSPQTIVSDSRRHGVEVRRPDINASHAGSHLEAADRSAGGAAVRLGFSYVRGIGDELASRLAAGQPYRDIEEVVTRAGLTRAQAEALATAGAFEGFGMSRRSALWTAGAVAAAGGGSGRRQVAGPAGGGFGGGGSPRRGRGSPPQPVEGAAEGVVATPGGGTGGFQADPGRSGAAAPSLCAVHPPIARVSEHNADDEGVEPARSTTQSGEGPNPLAPAPPSGVPAGRPHQERLTGLVTGGRAPTLPGMTPVEASQADLWATGLSPDTYPTEFVRADLAAAGVVTAAGLVEVPAGDRVKVAGVVTHRQRPATAQGVTFINLEDETGLINVVCSKGCWARYRRAARSSPALVIDGRLERVETVINVVAERIQPLVLDQSGSLRSRDFR
ncbi:MAG TPA: error-prone DNA polymerase, partial [Acidimicrobiales bacterium]|nr:error-prone DNA polymerase [Acidimicrobiales bacterium]